MSHASFSPSASGRWLACPGSWAANANKHSESSAAAIEGTEAHAFAEFCLLGKLDPMAYVDQSMRIADWNESKVITKEMAEAVLIYTEYVKARSRGSDKVAVEAHFQMPGHPSFWGTADHAILHDWGPGEITDFKYGVGIDVWPKDNPQIAAYLLGLLSYARANGITLLSLRGTIIQPRVRTWDGPRTWEITDIAAFEAEWVKKFEDGIVACLGEDPPRNPGDHCGFCDSKLECPELKDKLILAAIDEFKEDPAEMKKADIVKLVAGAELDELLRIHKHASIVKKFLDEAAKHLLALAESGTQIPGYKVVQSVGNRTWKLSDEEMAKKFRNKKLKQNDFYVTKVKSPAQIEKIMLDPKFMEKFVTRPVKGLALVPDSDKRPAVERIDAKDEFADLVE